MTTVHPTLALYDSIRSQIATSTGRPCGEAVRPSGASPPYSVVYPLPDRETFGVLSDPNHISLQLFQVTCVGNSMDAAQELQFDVRTALLGFIPTVAGRTPNRIELDLGSGVRRDDRGGSSASEKSLFFTTDRFTLYVD